MKTLVALLLITIAITQVWSVSTDQEWEDYKAKFNKSYKSPEEEQMRKDIYVQNKQKVEEHNAKYKKGEVSYSLGINHFSDRTHEEIKQMHGLRKPN